MTFRVTGTGSEPVSFSEATLEEAARAAAKMEDQGVSCVRVFDASGNEVLRPNWEAAWHRWAALNRPPS